MEINAVIVVPRKCRYYFCLTNYGTHEEERVKGTGKSVPPPYEMGGEENGIYVLYNVLHRSVLLLKMYVQNDH